MTGFEEEPPFDDDPIVEAAAAWIAKLKSEDANDEDRAAFARWREADPAHAAAYDEMHRLWQRIGEVPDPRRRRKPPPGGVAALAATALALGMMAYQFGFVDDWRSDIKVPVGSVQARTLADGSKVWLNSDAALALRFSPGERGIDLLRGEAVFEVTPDPARPFVVRGAGVQARAVGTRFYVRVDGATDPVGVSEGHVEVRSGDDRLVLGPGEVAHHGSNGDLVAAPGDVERRLAWRDGKLIYSGEQLADVLADIGRYRHGRIVLLDRAAGAMRVSATLDARDPDAALNSLAQVLGLKLTRLTPLLVLVQREG